MKKRIRIDRFNNPNLYSNYGYKTIDNHPQMGMYNVICENPKAFCSSKRVWLNEEQIEKCLHKIDNYGYGYRRCDSLKLI